MNKLKPQQPFKTSIQKSTNRSSNPQACTIKAPPPYHPQPIPKCLQLKAASPRPKPPSGRVVAAPSPPAAYRPQPVPKVLQKKAQPATVERPPTIPAYRASACAESLAADDRAGRRSCRLSLPSRRTKDVARRIAIFKNEPESDVRER
jgi:hypothetical protein